MGWDGTGLETQSPVGLHPLYCCPPEVPWLSLAVCQIKANKKAGKERTCLTPSLSWIQAKHVAVCESFKVLKIWSVAAPRIKKCQATRSSCLWQPLISWSSVLWDVCWELFWDKGLAGYACPSMRKTRMPARDHSSKNPQTRALPFHSSLWFLSKSLISF